MAANYVEIVIKALDSAKPDIEELQRLLDELGRTAAAAKVKVEGDAAAQATLARIFTQLDRLNRYVASGKVTVEGAARAIATMARLQAALDRFGRTDATATATIKTEGRGGLAGGGLLGGLLGGGGKLTVGSGATGWIGSVQKALNSILSLGPNAIYVLAGIAAAIVVIIDYFSSLVAAVTAAGIGIGAFGLLAMPTLSKITGGISAVSAAANAVARDKAWDAIPAALQPSVRAGLALQGTFNQMVQALQPQVVRIFGEALKGIANLLPSLLPIAKTVATAIEGLLRGFDQFSKSQGFKSFMASMQQLAAPAVTIIGKGLGQIALALGQFIQQAASPQGLLVLKGALWLVAGAIRAISWALRLVQDQFNIIVTGLLDIGRIGIDVAKAVTDGFLTMISTMAGFAAKIPGLSAAFKHIFGVSQTDIKNWADSAKRSADSTFANIIAGFSNLAAKIRNQPVIFRLQGDITQLQNAIAAARLALNNPKLTHPQKIQIQADISQAQQQIAAIQVALNALNGTVATTYVQTIPIGGGTYLRHAAGGIIGAAAGGIQGALRLVGEQGPELVRLPPGSQVWSNPDTQRMLAQAGGGAATVRLVLAGGDGPISRAIMDMLTGEVISRGGGNVQLALGRED